jgi:4-hydroxy-tetrahydrodipicolinate synthase
VKRLLSIIVVNLPQTCAGSDGAVVLGTTGEGSIVSAEERAAVIKTAVRAANGVFPIIIGTGTIGTDNVIAMSKQAKELGADATLVITPYYVKPPQRALVTHFTTIADAVDIPMIIYNCPGRTGVDMKPDTIGEIAKHPRVIGVKDATGDLTRVEAIRKVCGKDFLIFR